MNSSQELNGWRGSFLKYVLFLGFVTLVGFSVDYWTSGRYLYAISEFVVGLVLLVTFLLLIFEKIGWKVASYFGWLGILFILFMVLIYGGIGGVGLAWWGMLPMLSFMFFGIEWGLFATLAGSTIPAVILLFEYSGVNVSYFDTLQLRQLLLMIFVMGIIMSSYERAARILLKKLTENSERIASESEERILVEQELAQRLLELNTRAKKDEKIRMAIVNILEDERLLEVQLKKEKEGVENKVEERTKELLEEKQRLFKFLDSVPQGVFVLTKEGKPFFANKTAKEILGKGVIDVTPDELIKTYRIYKVGTDELYPTEDQPSYKALKGEVSTVSDMEVVRDDKRIPIRVTGAPIYNSDKTIEYAIVVFYDISEEIVLNRSRDEFFSIASHELRTPLTAIRGNTEMILDNYKSKIKDKDVLEMLSDVHEGSVRLIEIVNDFLNVSRLEMGKIDFKIEKTNLVDVINETIEEFRSSNLKPDLDIKVNFDNSDLQVMVDKDRLKQVLINLIGNAFKFTEKGGVYFEGFVVSDGLVEIDVRDTGSGIAPEQQGLLFRKFQQAGSSLYTRDTSKGTGLGLYISSLLMMGMKGKIWLKSSAINKGSIFSFTVPLAKGG